MQLNEEKSFIRDLYRESLVFLGYELRGGNLYPPQEAVDRLQKKMRIRGQEARLTLMKGFVRRYSIGPVRKLFRRIDRSLNQLYPPGISLTGVLDAMQVSRKPARGRVMELETVRTSSPAGESRDQAHRTRDVVDDGNTQRRIQAAIP